MKDTPEILELSSSDFDAADTAEMDVVINGRASGWKWTFAGPGHPLTVAQGNRLSRERLHRERQIEQARANNKKWKAEDEDVDEVRERSINWVVERLVGWPTIKLDGELLEFSQDAARKLLSDPRKVDLFVQAMEFLAADNSFTKRSATN